VMAVRGRGAAGPLYLFVQHGGRRRAPSPPERGARLRVEAGREEEQPGVLLRRREAGVVEVEEAVEPPRGDEHFSQWMSLWKIKGRTAAKTDWWSAAYRSISS
jgi:hypothetical protein